MFDLGVLCPEAQALLKVLSPKPLYDTYKISLNIKHIYAGREMEAMINVPLAGEYRSSHNATLMCGLFREMSNDDIEWCLKDYPQQLVGKVKSFTPVIVKM